ncbi:MAG: hypothetical protein EPN97_00475 [Alphaproteobacteria bacterium]|nr:MAG: hypothetical protein EPN97_00475 [Alphaproteobacteria bacterium]
MAKLYAAYQIDEASREKLLSVFKPKYPDVIAHHITHKYGAGPEDVPPLPEHVRVVGYHDSGAIQVLVVDIDGKRNQVTPPDAPKKFYHITLSLDRSQGVSPSKSNGVLQAIAAEKGEAAVYNLPEPVEISAVPRLLLDPPSFAEAMEEAKKILSHKTAGPNGVIAYAVVNDEKKRADGVIEPFFNPQSDKPLHLAYAFFESNHVGIPVITAPGGTQDLTVTHLVTGEVMNVQLSKEKSLKEALQAIQADVPGEKNLDKLERYTVAKLIEKGWRVEIEDSFTTAVREAKEEQGIDLTLPGSYIGAPMQFDRPAITKRTIDRVENLHRAKLFDIRDANDLGDVLKIAAHIREAAPPGIEPDAMQRLFAIQVPGFSSVELADSGEKIEDKIRGREGCTYTEKGTFVTLARMEEQLNEALQRAKAEEDKGNSFAGREIVANLERLNIYRRIEACIVSNLQAQGLDVTTAVSSFVIADSPDAIDTEHAGTAGLPVGLKNRIRRTAQKSPGL